MLQQYVWNSSHLLVILVFNVVLFSACFFLFSIMRKCTNLFGPKFFHSNSVHQHTTVFEGNMPFACDERMEILQDTKNLNDVVLSNSDFRARNEIYQPESRSSKLHSFWRLIWFAESEELIKECGHEGALWIQFEKMLVWLFFIFTALSCTILIPIHVTGTSLDGQDWFASTSIQKVALQGERLWVHVLLIIIFTILFIGSIHYFSCSQLVRNYLYLQDKDLIGPVAVMLSNLSPDLVTREQLIALIQKRTDIPSTSILTCEIGLLDYIPRLTLQKKSERAKRKLRHAIQRKIDGRERLIRRYWCFGSEIETSYWEEKVAHYEDLIQQWEQRFHERQERESRSANSTRSTEGGVILPWLTPMFTIINSIREPNDRMKSSGYAFVVLDSTETQKRVRKSLRWWATVGPEPEDIQWSNIAILPFHRFLVQLFLTILFVLFIVFFTTPVSIVTMLTQVTQLYPFSEIFTWLQSIGLASTLMLQYLPSLLILLFTILIPQLINKAVVAEKHLLHTTERRNILGRLWFYLILNLLLLPSVALATLQAFIEYATSTTIGELFNRLFLPSGGTFFAALLLQAACFGNLFQLWNPFAYIAAWFRRQKNDDPFDRNFQALIPYFEFEKEYAILLSFASVGFVYSILSPLVMACGFLFLLVRYCINRYNLRCLFRRSERHLSKGIHSYRKQMTLLFELALSTCLFFLFANWVFFVTKRYVAHSVIVFTVFVLVLLYMVGMGIVWRRSEYWFTLARMDETVPIEKRNKFASAYVAPCFVHEHVREFTVV